jgi:ubiquinone/menaquinone biosynthesis C-methylase UbiE
MSFIKPFLHRIGLFAPLSHLRSGTGKYLRKGYQPHNFWNAWGKTFPKMEFQRKTYFSQVWLLEKINSHSYTSLLELGCGFGRNLEYLFKNNLPSHNVWGMDISEPMLRNGRASLPARCRLICGDIQCLPFPNKKFDLIFTHGILMHVPPAMLNSALSEIARVASGTIILVEETFWKGENKSKSVEINRYTFHHDYLQLLPAAGFEILETSESGGPVNMLLLVCRLNQSLRATSLAGIP